MYYIGLVFHGTLQSWGAVNLADVNKNSPRNTYMLPTKSAILGILRSAIGNQRSDEEDLFELKDIRIITRTDRQGYIARDYNVAERTHHGFKAGKTKEIPKFFLEDATFVTLIGHENLETIRFLKEKLSNPMWSPFLGRRAHVPTLPLVLGDISTEKPREFLEQLPIFWDKTDGKIKSVLYTDSVYSPSDNKLTMTDFPVNFNPKKRNYLTTKYGQYTKQHSTDKPSLIPLDTFTLITESFKNVN